MLLGTSQSILTAINDIFPPPEVTGNQGKHPISEKKIDNGGSLWSTRKEILGWLFDGITHCIELQSDKAVQINVKLKCVGQLNTVMFKDMEKLIGTLKHAACAIPVGKPLVAPLIQAIHPLHKPKSSQIPITKAIKDSLQQ